MSKRYIVRIEKESALGVFYVENRECETMLLALNVANEYYVHNAPSYAPRIVNRAYYEFTEARSDGEWTTTVSVLDRENESSWAGLLGGGVITALVFIGILWALMD